MSVDVGELTDPAILNLAKNMREADILECEAMGHTPIGALCLGYCSGPSLGVYRVTEGDPYVPCIGAFGCNPGLGTIWSLWADNLDWREQFAILKATPVFVEAMVVIAGRTLHNYVDIENKAALEWLRLSKVFRISDDIEQINGRSYLYFETDGTHV